MQEKVLWVGQEETDLGSDLISQQLTFKDQVNNNFSQKSGIIESLWDWHLPTTFSIPGHFMHSWTILNHGSLPSFAEER